MGKIGYGYGSEWHLLRYLGRHREALNRRILDEVGGDSVAWLDTPFAETSPFDAEWKGVEFLPETHPAKAAWTEFWPQTGNVPNWDAIGLLTRNGAREWLLVEAKAHREETRSFCTAKPKGGLGQITSALGLVKSALGVDAARDWLHGYYQYCNRIAVLHFLHSHGVPARLLFVYFTGDKEDTRRSCPRDPDEWSAELHRLDEHVGLPPGHPLADRLHKLFLPAQAASWSSPDPDGILAWHLDQEAPEVLALFRGHSVVNVEVHFFVNQLVTEDQIAELHHVTVTFDGSDDSDFWRDFWAAMRDARGNLVETRGLRLDTDEADKYVVPSIVRMWSSGVRSSKAGGRRRR